MGAGLRFVTVSTAAAAFGGVVLIVAVFCKRIRSTYFSTPLAAMLLGIALSAFATSAVDISFWANCFHVLDIASWLTLAIGQAVDRLGQDAPGAGLTCPPRAAEKIGVGYPAPAEGVVQGLSHLILASHLGQSLWTPFTD